MKKLFHLKVIFCSTYLLYLRIAVLVLFFQTLFQLASKASIVQFNDSLSLEIKQQLNQKQIQQQLNLAEAVKKLYELNDFKPYWVQAETNIKPTADAMLLLDCISQYGLSREDYHSKTLHYGLMHEVLAKNNLATSLKKAQFDIQLSDALLSVIHHLHFGKFNNALSANRAIENDYAINLLSKALNTNNLINVIESAQPQSSVYRKLQAHLRLAIGQYACDSYDIADSTLLKIRINLERLRWMDWEDDYIQVNIPSYSLTYHVAATSHHFKVIVGKPTTPTPQLQSYITHFNTAPDWRVPLSIFKNEMLPKALKDSLYFEKNKLSIYNKRLNKIAISPKAIKQISRHPQQYQAIQTAGCDNPLGKVVFRFNNSYDIYLHDSPEQQLFKKSNRAFSHGCIRVENAGQLARLLLSSSHQSHQVKNLQKVMKNYQAQTFYLPQKLPIKITYLTCMIEDEMLVNYPDIYQLDQSLIQMISHSPLN